MLVDAAALLLCVQRDPVPCCFMNAACMLLPQKSISEAVQKSICYVLFEHQFVMFHDPRACVNIYFQN